MKKYLRVALVLAASFALALLLCFAASAKESSPIVSHGLRVIAANSPMAKAGLLGGSVSFERDDFARALNLSRVESVTFRTLPPREDGELRLGTTVINEGESIKGGDLSLLCFYPAEKTLKTSFTFSANGTAYETECTVYMLDEVNRAPTISLASSLSLDVETYQNITHFGTLSAYDPDGDETLFEIVSYPKNGVLLLDGKTSGEYRYIPTASFAGRDSFSYIARDKYGNYSASATVSLTVNRSSLSVAFADMEDSSAHAAAISLTEKGIMSGTRLGDGYYFEPDDEVSRAEFVAMAMKALGIRNVTAANTPFADDDEIDSAMKGYIAAAYELGYVKGSPVEGELCFLPDDKISRAEAAVIVGRMIDAATPTVAPHFSDGEEIPVWAKSSVESLSALGILDAEGGAVRAKAALTRADTAKILNNIIRN